MTFIFILIEIPPKVALKNVHIAHKHTHQHCPLTRARSLEQMPDIHLFAFRSHVAFGLGVNGGHYGLQCLLEKTENRKQECVKR